MTSLKKPLIAIASAVALVTSFLVVSPASAAIVADLEVNNVNITAVATAADPVLIPVPSDNYVSVDQALELNFTVDASTVVSAVATNAKLVVALDSPSGTRVTSASGTGSYSVNSGTGTLVTFYAFTTSSAAGSVAVTIGGNTATYNLKGTAGSAYNLYVSAPAIAGLSVPVAITATATDVFGNVVEDAEITTDVLRGTVTTELAWNSSEKIYKGVITTPATSGTVPAVSTILSSDVAGLAKSKNEVAFTITNVDLADALAVANAKIAELEASVANKVTKKKYNKLARKWNKANPDNKVKPVK